jgi:crotonobetainyl-CoA:carnitine CoA-transferase CaiB-like acyl-CoA transferase
MTALALYGAIVTALLQRERTGKGAHVGTSLMASGVWANACFIQAALDGARFTPRPPRTEAFNALSNHYRCRNDRWLLLAVGVVQDARLWRLFAETLGRPELADDPRFADRAARLKNAGALVAMLDEIFLQRDGEEWMRLLESKGFVVALVARPSEALHDRQIGGEWRDRNVTGRWLHRQQPAVDRRRGKSGGNAGPEGRRAQCGDPARARICGGGDRPPPRSGSCRLIVCCWRVHRRAASSTFEQAPFQRAPHDPRNDRCNDR